MKKSISTDFKREHIIELLRQMARKFNGKFDIRLIYTFGSFISEHRVPQSDVDTAILLGEGHDSYSIFRAAELFKLEILHKIQRKIDISILNIADPLLKSVISKSIIMTVRKKIVGLVSLRNILVHVRLRIDRDIVYENLTHLDDFQQFIKYLTRNLNQ